MDISKEEVEIVFEKRKAAFEALATYEDEMLEVKGKLEDLKEGSKGYTDLMNQLKEMQPEANKLHREFTLATWEVEKLHLLMKLNTS